MNLISTWATFFCLCLFVLVCTDSKESEEKCTAINCIGREYECIGDRCYCAIGYVPNPPQTACIRCPGLGEKCMGPCCNQYGNGSLQCWQGTCQACYDSRGSWVCRDSLDQILLISITQVVMATALVLGIIATFVLLYKLCAATNLRPMGSSNRSRLSVGSLQVYVDERLRDAPPRYTIAVYLLQHTRQKGKKMRRQTLSCIYEANVIA
ncbi:hypothetical protein MSG28_002808 [Choristoneura fumiferana]|uniref:Uncharacterized protein n=1 Tax=Choristoneura fumiferana TaxID=7141 RepID=A0ACC0JJE9_CHOFU|nr:hypothetical protein MSG28_002808 [Choristoneura fumiferana]